MIPGPFENFPKSFIHTLLQKSVLDVLWWFTGFVNNYFVD
jgi:hypothetical protein